MTVVRSEAGAGFELMLQAPGMPEETSACQPKQWSPKLFTELVLTTLGLFLFPLTLIALHNVRLTS